MTPATVRADPAPRERMTVRGAVFLGVGSMVGAGIFALLGEAGAVAGAAVWISFLLAGLISAGLGYTLVKFGVRYPTSGGPITYLIESYGNGRIVGVMGWLGYFASLVVVGAMVALSFGDYAAKAFIASGASDTWDKVFGSAIVIASAILIASGAQIVDRAQSAIVVGLLAVFLLFIVATITQLKPHLLAPSGYPSTRTIASSVALTFFAFLGFAVISFTAGQLRDPRRGLPRAMYAALAVTTLLYVTISLCVFGTLTVAEVIHYGPTAIAEAARPTLGGFGYEAMSVAALLATASSVVATLYAVPGFTGALAEVGQFPPVFGTQSRFGRNGGLVLTTALTVVLLSFFSLAAVVSIGSAVSLAVFLFVAVGGLRRRRELQASVWLLSAAVASCTLALVLFATDTLWGDPRAFWTTVATVAGAVVIDTLWKRRRDDRARESAAQPS